MNCCRIFNRELFIDPNGIDPSLFFLNGHHNTRVDNLPKIFAYAVEVDGKIRFKASKINDDLLVEYLEWKSLNNIKDLTIERLRKIVPYYLLDPPSEGCSPKKGVKAKIDNNSIVKLDSCKAVFELQE